MKILPVKGRKYRFTYQNGVVQEKRLISKLLYDELISKAEAVKDKEDKDSREIQLTLWLKQIGPYFVHGSLLYQAIDTGVLNLPPYQGGPQICMVEII